MMQGHNLRNKLRVFRAGTPPLTPQTADMTLLPDNPFLNRVYLTLLACNQGLAIMDHAHPLAINRDPSRL
jgi:hypothetical protein